MSKVKFSLVVLTIFFIVSVAGTAIGGTFYIDSTNGSDSNAGSIDSPWKTISKANSELVGGDTVYLRAGTYTNRISPSNSGASGKYITYERYPNDPVWSVIVRTNSYAIFLEDKDHIKIDGIYFSHSGYRWAEITSNADYNVIQNCKFYDGQSYSGILIRQDCRFTRIVNNIFEDAPIMPKNGRTAWDDDLCVLPYPDSSECNSETAPADVIHDLGTGTLIQKNTFGKSSHQAIYGRGIHCVYRDNKISNEYHSLIATDIGRTLIEGNILSDGGYKKTSNPSYRDRVQINGAGLYLMADYTIARNNIVKNTDYGVYIGAKGSDYGGDNQYIYNNTIYNNWLQIVMFGNNSNNYENNVFKNNVIFNDDKLLNHKIVSISEPRTYQILRNSTDYPFVNTNYFIHNAWTQNEKTFYFKQETDLNTVLDDLESLYPNEWKECNFSIDNPLFEDASKGNLRLTSSSELIDSGEWLTAITSDSGSGKTRFKVEDANYFYDGWDIPGEVGDRIKTENGRYTTITNINYGTGEISVSPAIDIVKNEGIALVYFGKAPDIGAYETGLTPPILRIAQIPE